MTLSEPCENLDQDGTVVAFKYGYIMKAFFPGPTECSLNVH
jgi:hypothetical protein